MCGLFPAWMGDESPLISPSLRPCYTYTYGCWQKIFQGPAKKNIYFLDLDIALFCKIQIPVYLKNWCFSAEAKVGNFQEEENTTYTKIMDISFVAPKAQTKKNLSNFLTHRTRAPDAKEYCLN